MPYFRLPNGTWTGVVGDLIRGDIDISVAALTMTTEREEGTLFYVIFLSFKLSNKDECDFMVFKHPYAYFSN